MMFLGGFVSYTSSMDATPISPQSTEYVEITNAVFDEVYMDSDTSIEADAEIPTWGHTTLMNAKFQNNILAGNVGFTLASISGMVIKKRKINDYKWSTLYTFPIKTEADFDFFFNDIVVASNTTYEYAAVPIVNGVEGSYQTISVDVQFDGCFIVDKTNAYQVLLDFSCDNTTRQIKSTMIEPVNSKYPYVYYFGQSRYDRFPVTGTMIELNRTTGQWDVDNGWRYRKAFRDFIDNQMSKIVKFYDGRIYLASAVDTINESKNSHPDLIHTTVNFIEVGDVDSNADLYYHGFVDFLEVGN